MVYGYEQVEEAESRLHCSQRVMVMRMTNYCILGVFSLFLFVACIGKLREIRHHNKGQQHIHPITIQIIYRQIPLRAGKHVEASRDIRQLNC